MVVARDWREGETWSCCSFNYVRDLLYNVTIIINNTAHLKFAKGIDLFYMCVRVIYVYIYTHTHIYMYININI